MTTLNRCTPFGIVLAIAVLAAGCLGGSAPTRFYVLAPVDGAAVAGERPLAIGVGPVSLAGYLDRPQIVTRPAADKIDIGEFDQVLVDVTRFDGPAGGDTALEARWRVLDALTGKELSAKTTRLSEPPGGAGYPLTVSAMSRALGALSRDIAQTLVALPQ